MEGEPLANELRAARGQCVDSAPSHRAEARAGRSQAEEAAVSKCNIYPQMPPLSERVIGFQE